MHPLRKRDIDTYNKYLEEAKQNLATWDFFNPKIEPPAFSREDLVNYRPKFHSEMKRQLREYENWKRGRQGCLNEIEKFKRGLDNVINSPEEYYITRAKQIEEQEIFLEQQRKQKILEEKIKEKRLLKKYPKYKNRVIIDDLDLVFDFLLTHHKKIDKKYDEILKETGKNSYSLNWKEINQFRYQAFEEIGYKYGIEISHPYFDMETYNRFMWMLNKFVYIKKPNYYAEYDDYEDYSEDD